MNDKSIILTVEGKQKLEAELKEIKENKMPEIISKIEQAKEMGDLSENAEYHDAKDQQGLLASRQAEIEEILKNCSIAGRAEATGRIQIGTSFVVVDANGKEKNLTIVGFNEADPINGRISNQSPMGQAFLNKQAGDKVEIEVPRGLVVYTIKKIS